MPNQDLDTLFDELNNELKHLPTDDSGIIESDYIPSTSDNQLPEQKHKTQKAKMDPLSKVILTISVIVFFCSGVFLLYKYVGEPLLEQKELAAYKNDYDGESTASAKDGLWTDEEENKEEERLENGMLASFKNIVELNSDVVGWITVPGTPIDYPVVQAKNNSYYLTHNVNKEVNYSGCPFLDYKDEIGLNKISRNSIIYGHHRRNGTMFAKLTNYNKLDFYKENPVLRFDTVYNRSQWVIFANMRVTASSATGKPFNYMRTDFDDDEDYMQFVEEIRKRSLITTPVEVTASDNILLLSTCSYEKANWRLVIAARQLREGETSIDVSSATKAANPLMP